MEAVAAITSRIGSTAIVKFSIAVASFENNSRIAANTDGEGVEVAERLENISRLEGAAKNGAKHPEGLDNMSRPDGADEFENIARLEVDAVNGVDCASVGDRFENISRLESRWISSL